MKTPRLHSRTISVSEREGKTWARPEYFGAPAGQESLDTALRRGGLAGVSPDAPKNTLEVSDVLFFDNLALHYLVNDCPPPVLARVFVSADSRIGGCLLGVMSPKQRETIHALMKDAKDGDAEKNRDAARALMIIAEDIMKRGHIEKRGPRHFYGIPAEQD